MMKSLVFLPYNIQSDMMDMWKNVKIPFLEDGLDEMNRARNNGEWKDITWSRRRERFSSLAGVRVGDVGVGKTTFSPESTSTATTSRQST